MFRQYKILLLKLKNNSKKLKCVQVIIFFKVLHSMEDIKVREMQIFDYKKTIAEAETKLKQQQNLYEAVRSDRNLYSKNLIEAQVGPSISILCI